jgi:Protein of unknown function (DUF2505)
MARPIERRASFGHLAERVLAAMTDAEYLRQRLAEIGGERSALVSHTIDGGTSKAVMRQGIDARHLPGVVQRIAPGGVLIERTEIWQLAGEAPFSGTITATVDGMPGTLRATSGLRAVNTEQSELSISGSVRVSIPLVGGKVEEVIADQLGRLIDAEAQFTNRWLSDH